MEKSAIPRRAIEKIGASIRIEGGYRRQAPVAICFCAIVFLLDAFTLADGLASALYILVLVWFAERRQREAVLAASLACILLTLATYPFADGDVLRFDPVFRRMVSCAAIVITTPLILQGLRLRDAVWRQDTFLDLTNHPIMLRDAAGAIRYWNGAAERLYGWTAAEAMGQNFRRLLGAAFLQPDFEIESILQRQGFWEGQSVNRTRTGETVTVLHRWFGRFSENDGAAVLDIGTDITSVQHVAERLRLSEERYRSIFNTVNIGIWEEDFSAAVSMIEALEADGVDDFEKYCAENPGFADACTGHVRLVDVNEGAVVMFEAGNKAELLGPLEKFHLPEKTVFFARILAAIARGERFFSAVMMARTLRGRALPIIVSINLPGARERMNSVFVSVVDDSERRKIQESLSETRERLVRAGQVTALGDMTARIAHQVNHPLAAIIANSEAALRWLNRPDPDFEEATEAVEAAFQNGISASRVVKHIRSLGAYDLAQNAIFSIEEVCEDSCRLLERELTRNDILVKRDFAPPRKPVFGDKIQIEQVILNLMSNAIEALSNCPVPRELTLSVRPEDEANIRISIQDNGAGIEDAAMAKLFQPFYTTKPCGMGLGLAICRAIVESHKGKIWASKAMPGMAVQFTLAVASSASLSTYW